MQQTIGGGARTQHQGQNVGHQEDAADRQKTTLAGVIHINGLEVVGKEFDAVDSIITEAVSRNARPVKMTFVCPAVTFKKSAKEANLPTNKAEEDKALKQAIKETKKVRKTARTRWKNGRRKVKKKAAATSANELSRAAPHAGDNKATTLLTWQQVWTVGPC